MEGCGDYGICKHPKDLSRVKSKLALNMTKRQLICFGSASAIVIPTYIFTRGAIGNNAAALLMIAVMLPLFFLAMYEKDGLLAEVILRNYIRTSIFWPGIRPYKTENLYETIGKEAQIIASKNKTAAKASVRKCPAGKRKPRRYERGRKEYDQ